MAGICSVCRHPQRKEIDLLLLSPASPTLAEIARSYNLSTPALSRHQTKHIAQSIARAVEFQNLRGPVRSILEQVKLIAERFETTWNAVEEIMQTALRDRNPDLALRAVSKAVAVGRELRSTLEVIGNATGELKTAESRAGGGIIILPLAVPVGTPADLNARVPPEAIQEALKRREGKGREVIDVEAKGSERLRAAEDLQGSEGLQVPPPKLLPGGAEA